MTPEMINGHATAIYAQNRAVGWWDDPNRCPLQCLMLVVTEVAYNAKRADHKRENRAKPGGKAY